MTKSSDQINHNYLAIYAFFQENVLTRKYTENVKCCLKYLLIHGKGIV